MRQLAGRSLVGAAIGVVGMLIGGVVGAAVQQAWTLVRANYVDRQALDPGRLSQGAISGLLGSLGDAEHTRFLSPADLARPDGRACRPF